MAASVLFCCIDCTSMTFLSASASSSLSSSPQWMAANSDRLTRSGQQSFFNRLTDRVKKSFAVICVSTVLLILALTTSGYKDDVTASAEAMASAVQDRINNYGPLPWSSTSGNQLDMRKDRITLIAMWTDDRMATYLPPMLKSARNNADAVDLLWINVLRHSEECLDISGIVEGASNINTLCITDHENKRMIRDYFCGKWECSAEQVAHVDAHLTRREDKIHVEFKPWRGMIYREHIHTEWWAWIDTDQVIGDFRAIWPWKTVDFFDFVTISEWDYGNIYLRGQFTAFRLSDKMDNVWLSYPPLSAPEHLHKLPHGVPDEFEYSVLYSNVFKNLNWILLPRALGADKFGRNKVVFHNKKAYYVPSDMRRRDIALLFSPRFAIKSEPLFAPVNDFNPKEYAVPVRELRHGDYLDGRPLHRWCDQRETRCTAPREYYHYRSVVMRYDGELLEYFDQRSRPRTLNLDTYLGIEEKLFLHWQEVKRPKWFKMPEDGVGDDDILEVNVNYVVTFNRKTLETTFVAERDGTTFRMMPEPLGHGYNNFNGSRELRLPPAVLADLDYDY